MRVALTILVLTLITGCSRSAGGEAELVDSTRAIHRTVDDLADHLYPAADPLPEEDVELNGRMYCSSKGDTVRSYYGQRFSSEGASGRGVIRRAAEYLSAEDYVFVELETNLPERVTVDVEGAEVAVEIAAADTEVHITGTTGCFNASVDTGS